MSDSGTTSLPRQLPSSSKQCFQLALLSAALSISLLISVIPYPAKIGRYPVPLVSFLYLIITPAIDLHSHQTSWPANTLPGGSSHK